MSIAFIFPKAFSNLNFILLILASCSLVAMAIFIERILQLRKAEMDTNAFVVNLRTFVKRKEFIEAVRVCDETRGAIAHIIKSGLLKFNQARDQIERAMERRGLIEIARLEKNAKVLSIIAHIAPLIGLLGTVVGFIQAFGEMRLSGLMDISTSRLGEAMEYALVTTAAGLVVAIPCVLAYNYLVSRIENLVLEMQVTSSEIVDLIVHHMDDDAEF